MHSNSKLNALRTITYIVDETINYLLEVTHTTVQGR